MESFLEPLNAGKNQFSQSLDETKKLTSDNPKQQERLAKLLEAKDEWIKQEVEPLLALRKQGASVNDVVRLVQGAKGKKQMDAMRGLLAEMKKEEISLLSQRMQKANSVETRTKIILIGGTILCALLAALIAYVLTRNITMPLSKAVDAAKGKFRPVISR